MTTEITKQTDPAQVVEQLAAPVEVLPPLPDRRALNGVTHGLTAQHVPPDEREGYARHVEQIRAVTGAQNYLEQRLADRAALALWRLDRVARYEAAQAGNMRRAALERISEGATYGPAQYVTAAYARLADLIGYFTPEQLRDAQQVEEEAQERDRYAAHLSAWAEGGSAAGLDKTDAAGLGWVLFEALADNTSPAYSERKLAAAILGRTPKRSEVEALKNSEWEFEPGELPALVEYARQLWGDRAAFRLRSLAEKESAKAAQIRAAFSEAQAAEADALAVAALPQAEQLEKITRYEAHLERVLYRALHDLEAARRDREGKDSPGPVRVALDGPSE